MMENPSTDSSAAVKRYAPPNQRNRGLGRLKSGGERLESAISYTNDGEKAQASVPKNVSLVTHGDAGSSSRITENSFVGLIPLHGCCNTEAFQLLNDRWAAALNAMNSLPVDSPERPLLYSRSGLPLGHAMLPHLLMPAAASAGLKEGFLGELSHAIRSANALSDT